MSHAGIPKETRAFVLSRDWWLCWICGNELTANTATMDHVIPVSLGGSNSRRNLRAACRSCNEQRGNRIAGDIYPRGDGLSATISELILVRGTR